MLGCAASVATPVVDLPTDSPVPITASSAAVNNEEPPPKAATPSPESPRSHTCSMHPQIREAAAGTCPICGMDLVEVPTKE
jgi:hypothetical protein